MRKTLALVMVVKNEQKGLEKAILSAKPFVDEIVIAVDRASQDNTYAIANKYATKLKFFDWCDDFAWARNFAHEGVQSDYILFLDGHEYIEKCENLQEYLNKDENGLLVKIRMETGAEFNNPRIYKNGIQFVGKVHEKQQIENAIFYPDFIIQHDRANGQDEESKKIREEQRDDQIPRIMGLEIEKDPSNIRASFHLILYYLSKSNTKKALKYQKLYLKHSKYTGERYFVLFSRALVLSSLNKGFRAFWVASKAESEESKRWETEKLKGLILFNSGKYEKALPHLVNSFNQNIKNHAYSPWPRDDAGTWNLIGECFYQRRVYDKASTAFYMASTQTKNEQEKKFFLDRSKILAKLAKT